MGTYSKRYVVEVETLFKTINGKTVEKSTKRIENLGRGVQNTTTQMTKQNSRGKDIVTTTNRMTRGFERFQMEQLGVMFGGMALNRAMNTLNATSREWLGIGELTSTMMGITMLNANIDLLEYGVIPLFDALTNLPPIAQKAIGYLAFGLESLGMTMMVGGQFMLGLDSTATLLSKIAGVRPELIFSEKGLSGLKNKLSGVMPLLGRVAKYAAAGVLIGIALKDVSEDQYTAALGAGAMAAGLIKGGKTGAIMFTIGLGLKLIGDEDFLVDVLKIFYKIGAIITSVIKEAVSAGLTFRDFDMENIAFAADIGNAFKRAREEIQMEEAGAGVFETIAFPTVAMSGIQEQMDEAKRAYEKHSEEIEAEIAENTTAIDALYEKKKNDLVQAYENEEIDRETYLTELIKLEEDYTADLNAEYIKRENALKIHNKNMADLVASGNELVSQHRDAQLKEDVAVEERGAKEVESIMGSLPGKLMLEPRETLLDVGQKFLSPWESMREFGSKLPFGSKAVGGPIRKTGPYMLHEGEEVTSKLDVKSGQIIVNTTYNVNVSDKREFESLLRKNNQQLTSDVRRIVKT